jgi:hypothetical protein
MGLIRRAEGKEEGRAGGAVGEHDSIVHVVMLMQSEQYMQHAAA